MAAKRNLPFQNLTPTSWLNLAAGCLLVFYVIQISLDVYWQNTCGHLAIDYCTFWSAGAIANKFGYARVYDLNLMSEVQKAIFPKTSDFSNFKVVPTPYLPVFILPFQLLSLINPASGFWIWTLLNLTIYFFYLRFFARATTKTPLQTRLLILLSLSLPLFLNFLYGQVNVWLMICIGEFIRTTISDRPFYAGLWLGGLLIKPQSLILIIPVLLFQRAHKTVAGFATSSIIVLGTSFILMGYAGYITLINLWIGYANGIQAAIGPEIMMNWRMIGLNLNSILPQWVGLATMVIGLALTLSAVIFIWRNAVDTHNPGFEIALLGTLAATALIAWHSHVSTSIILITPLIYLTQPVNRLPRGALMFWVFIPAFMYIIVFILDLFVHLGILTSNTNTLLNFLSGGGEFVLNIYFLVWAVKCFRNHTEI